MSSIAIDPLSRRTSVAPREPDPLPTPTAAAATGPAATTPRPSDPTEGGEASLRSAVSSLIGPSGLHRIASESDDSSGKPPARTADLPPGVGSADDFTRGNK
jgi:hypothetical protein